MCQIILPQPLNNNWGYIICTDWIQTNEIYKDYIYTLNQCRLDLQEAKLHKLGLHRLDVDPTPENTNTPTSLLESQPHHFYHSLMTPRLHYFNTPTTLNPYP